MSNEAKTLTKYSKSINPEPDSLCWTIGRDPEKNSKLLIDTKMTLDNQK